MLGVSTGLSAGGVICGALRDKPLLTDEERHAMCVGRHGSVGSDAFGGGGSACGGCDGVTGYSVAGLTSGLAVLDGAVDSGMAQGILAALFTSALFAAGSGHLLYRVVRWFVTPTPEGLAPGAG